MYHKAILITTSQFVLFSTEPVQTFYKMKSDILCLKEVISMDKNSHTFSLFSSVGKQIP